LSSFRPSIFARIFGTAYLTEDEPTSFGVDDPEYPLGNIAAQFAYAFRPSEKRLSDRVGPARTEAG
jgi:hypothetical protein